jgi:hypothetical protein
MREALCWDASDLGLVPWWSCWCAAVPGPRPAGSPGVTGVAVGSAAAAWRPVHRGVGRGPKGEHGAAEATAGAPAGVVAAERVEARGQRPWGVGQREVPGQGSGARLGLTSHWSRTNSGSAVDTVGAAHRGRSAFKPINRLWHTSRGEVEGIHMAWG